MAETRDFDVVRIARSDGADSGPGYWPVTATPAANAAKKTGKEVAAPRAKAQMIRLDEDDPRFIEWRIKLGILLKQELSLNPDEGNPWYVHFPRGYWLYEKSKHLWVSGYPIKAKLFKTPQEFGLHLIWLLSTSMDYMDCCCIHCNVPSLTKTPSAPDSSTPTPAHLAPPNPANIPPKVSPVPLPTIPGQSPKQATNGSVLQPTPKASPRSKPAEPVGADPRASAVQAQPYTQNHPQIQPPAQNQGISQAQPTVQPQGPPQMQSQAQPQPQTQTRPQAIKWSLQAPFLFRAGELVWYQNGNSWRLGVIAGPGNESFQLIPIGHSAAKQPNVTKVCKEMRPFHAFSVPGVMLPDLQNQVFDQVPWENLFLMAGQDRAKRNNPILDASKMAASKIDASFSLWCPLSDDVYLL
ncbi:hypothetical protein HIM_10912 [Hirsutella minnesotensis 3608]|uniref:Cryptic loci regulator 2 N-terminal domain-containing protein n=1 Tax=Hirsutella minnesotensis 3608 TaxID=1043627 RepID=A0A0F7ZFT3_9HYPO|nr:hypothetical protein HIM_10912 [Hirsutella minnesotensis 3608]